MFRITRGMTTQHGPAFSPIFRFSDGDLLPLVGDDEAGDVAASASADGHAITPSAAEKSADDGEAAASAVDTDAQPS